MENQPSVVLTQLNYDLPMALGTREGHIMLYYNSKTDIKTLRQLI